MSAKAVVCGVVVVGAIVGGVFTVKSIEKIPTGKVGVQYSANGVKDEVLDEGIFNW